MKTGNGMEALKEFKQDATEILEEGRFPVHKTVRLYVFADASNTACSAVTIAVVDHSKGFV